MADPRTVKLAEILVNHSITVKKGSKIVIEYQAEAHPLAMQCYTMLLKKGAFPIMRPSLPGTGYAYFKYAGQNN